MDQHEEMRPPLRDRIAHRSRQMAASADRKADNMEARYLSILRYSLLIIATALALFALWSLGFGLVRQIGSTTVEPDRFAVSPDKIAPAPVSSAAAAAAPAQPEGKFALSPPLKKLTLQTYRTSFAPFERAGEDADAERILAAVWPRERREAFETLALNSLVTDKDGKPVNDGERLALMAVETAGAATREPGLTSALNSYRQAKKVKICEYRTRTRQRTVSTWNSYSTSCTGWYEYPYGCPSTEQVNEPYTENVCEMRFPSDLESPPEAMASAVQRFADFATAEGDRARNDAMAREGEVASRKLRGREGMVLGAELFLGFLAVMLTYLFVALERHHRVLRGLVASREPTLEQQAVE